MRHFGLALSLVCLVVATSTYAADGTDTVSKKYAVSFGVGNGAGLSVRMAVSKATWFFASATVSALRMDDQYTFNGTTTSTSYSDRIYSAQGGFRHYLSDEKLSSFLQLSLGESFGKHYGNGADASSRYYMAAAVYGLEYYLAPQLSVEGVAGLSYVYYPHNGNSYSFSSYRSMSFPNAGVAITYYW